MQFSIDVVEVNEIKDKKNAKGGVFNAAEVVYKKDGKVEAKSFPDWANKDIYPSLLALKKGDVRTVTTEKVNGYWQWLSINPADQAGESQQVATETTGSSSAASTRGTGKVIGSNYETAEERARRQVMIVRQSSLGHALELIKVVNPKGTAVDEGVVIAVAQKFEGYVLGA